jgi:glycerophosphoryl diester phosphodiesterase
MSRLAEAGIDAVNLHHRAVTPRVVAAARSHGMLVFAWGVRRRTSVASVLARGADGVFADDAEALVAAVPTGASAENVDPVSL